MVGAGLLARRLAAELRTAGRVTLVDRSLERVEQARAEGFTALLGDALDVTGIEQVDEAG